MTHECMLCGPTINSKLMIIYLNGNDSIYYSFKPIVNTWYETELTVYYVIVVAFMHASRFLYVTESIILNIFIH